MVATSLLPRQPLLFPGFLTVAILTPSHTGHLRVICGGMSVRAPRLFLNSVFSLFDIELREFFICSECQILIKYMICESLLPFCGLTFHHFPNTVL